MFNETSIWTGVIAGGISQIQDTKAVSDGQISKQIYAAHTSKNVIGSIGTMAGIEYGAILGSSIFPGVGTIIGSIIGGMVGDGVGSYVGWQTGKALFNRNENETEEISTIQKQFIGTEF